MTRQSLFCLEKSKAICFTVLNSCMIDKKERNEVVIISSTELIITVSDENTWLV